MPDAPLPPLPPEGQPPWRTFLDELRRRVPAPLGTLVMAMLAIAVAGLVVVSVVRLRPAPPAAVATLPTAVPAPAEPDGPPATATRAQGRAGEEEVVVVDVTGAVGRPGLVRLRGGDRVADAVAAAGGVTAEAETAGLNQARVVADGEQVRVPRAGEAPPPAPAAPGGAGSPVGGSAAPVDLNRATLTELDTLPGVGPATATAIIAWRDENGGFRRVDDLLEVPGIGSARLERLRPLVRV